MTDDPERALLVNHWYANPVGHAIEALRYCLGYHAADPSLRVSVLLNGATPCELADFCPFIDSTYAVGFTDLHDGVGDPAPALRDVPRDWDWLVDEHRSREDFQLDAFPGLRRFYEAAGRHFRPRLGHGIAGTSPPGYVPHQLLRLALPAGVRASASRLLEHSEPRIAVMPAGSGPRPLYPSVTSWNLILDELSRAFPGSALCLLGKLRRDGRTATSMTHAEVDGLMVDRPNIVDAFDRPLVEQLALVEACQVFVSPHTGFGMAAVAVGTPWLALSGGRWFESFFNAVPFYSVIPDTERYPCFPDWAEPLVVSEGDTDGEGPRTPSVSAARIAADLPELLEAARLLIEGRLSYEESLARYFTRLVRALQGDRDRVYSFDGAHVPYVWPEAAEASRSSEPASEARE